MMISIINRQACLFFHAILFGKGIKVENFKVDKTFGGWIFRSTRSLDNKVDKKLTRTFLSTFLSNNRVDLNDQDIFVDLKIFDLNISTHLITYNALV
jgi:hypothetical protein